MTRLLALDCYGSCGGYQICSYCKLKYDNPEWLGEIVATKMPSRRCLGVYFGDIEDFMDQFNVRAVKFDKDIPEVIEGSEIVTEVIKKEYRNITDEVEEDEVEIKGQRFASHNSSRNYQLTIGHGSMKFNVGGAVGLSAAFFNFGGDGVAFTSAEAPAATLGKEYSIMSKIKIPPKTRLNVTITTYSCTFRLADVQVLLSTKKGIKPKDLPVRLADHYYVKRRKCDITPEDFLTRLCDPGTVNTELDNRVTGTTMAQLTYLGEETKVTKEVLSNL